MAVVEASKEALWLRGLVGTFGIIQDSIQIYCDSQSAIHLVKDRKYYKRTKHIDVRYHMIRQSVAVENVIDLIKIRTKEESSRHIDKNHPGGEVQSISELHQCSPKIN